jgi:hypothetical protein
LPTRDLATEKVNCQQISAPQHKEAVMEEQLPERQFNWETFKRWRTIQLASLFPLVLSGVFMLYFKEASPLGIMAFFLVLIIGILLPQVRGDLILSHIVLSKEFENTSQKLEERMVSLLDERLGKAHARKSESPQISRSIA